jgi:hypothetical protein
MRLLQTRELRQSEAALALAHLGKDLSGSCTIRTFLHGAYWLNELQPRLFSGVLPFRQWTQHFIAAFTRIRVVSSQKANTARMLAC